jgi:hypothetical protein
MNVSSPPAIPIASPSRAGCDYRNRAAGRRGCGGYRESQVPNHEPGSTGQNAGGLGVWSLAEAAKRAVNSVKLTVDWYYGTAHDMVDSLTRTMLPPGLP